MKRQFRWLPVCLAAIFLLSSCSPCMVAWNGEYESFHVTMAKDETNLYQTAGSVDYIFLGSVREVKRNVVDYTSADRSGYSVYAVTVQDNLKGKLAEEIICYLQRGYLKDGTLLYPQSDQLENRNPLPEVGEQYLFMAYGQSNGDLILDLFHGDVAYTGEAQRAQYLEYIANSIADCRQRFVSKYDAAIAGENR